MVSSTLIWRASVTLVSVSIRERRSGVAVQVVGVRAEQLLLPGDGRIQIPQLLVGVPHCLVRVSSQRFSLFLVVQFAHLTGDGGALLLHFVQFHGHCPLGQ